MGLSLESVQELVRQALMRMPNDLNSAHQLVEYRAQRREASRRQLIPLRAHLPMHLGKKPPVALPVSGAPLETEANLVDMDHLALSTY